MGFKKYIVLSILFIVAVYGYLFSLELGEYQIKVLEYSFTLPIAVWIIIPLVVLFVATIGHIVFYGLLNILKVRAVNKDHELLISMLKAKLLEKNFNKKFKTKGFKNLSSILSQFELEIKDNTFSSPDDELNNIVATIKDIKAGKYIENRSIKFSEISKVVKNNKINKVNQDADFAYEVLKKSENYDNDILKEAFEKILRDKSMTTVKKVYKNIKLDKTLAKKLFEKDAANNEFGFTAEEILRIVKSSGFTQEDYMALAKNYESNLQPDQIIALFEKLSSQIDEATSAYLHVLFEYEMIEKAREVIQSTQEDEFTAFKALLELKDAGKHYDLESISYK